MLLEVNSKHQQYSVSIYLFIVRLFGLSCERPLWCPMWNPVLTKIANLDDGGGTIIFWPCACWIFKKIPGEILVCHPGGSIIFWPCTCWIFKKILGEILVCHPGGSIIFWPCAYWIFKKNSMWDLGLSSRGVNHLLTMCMLNL